MDDPSHVHVVEATVPCAAWLAQRGQAALACEMRDEFMYVWGFGVDEWNAAVDAVLDFALRQGEPGDQFEAIRA